MATLKSVSELIKKNDEVMIDELEGQSKSLDDINRGIQKFLGVNERKRLDDLEDRRERRSKLGGLGLGILAGGAAGAGLAGAAGGGLLEKIIAGVVGSVLTALGIGAIRTTKRVLDALSKDSSNLRSDNKDLKNRIKDLERQAKTDAKSLQDQKKAFDTETKRLQSEIRSVQKELKSERAVNGDRIKQLEGRISTLQSQLDTVRTARTDIVTEQMKAANQADTLKALRSDLSKAESSRFAQRQRIMNVNEELRLQEAERAAGQAEVGKFRRMASAMQFQKELHGGFTKGQKLIYRAGNGNLSIVEVKGPALDGSGRLILETTTPNGGKVSFVGVPDRILGEASPDDMRNLRQAQRLGTQPDVRMVDTTAPRTGIFSKLTRPLNLLDPIGLAEEISRGGAAVSRSAGATGTAARLTGLARFLGGTVGLSASIILTPSETGGRINTPSGATMYTSEGMGGYEANMIMKFLGYLRGSGGSALKQMMDLRKQLRERATIVPDQFEQGVLAVFGKLNPDTGILEINGNEESVSQFLSLLMMSDSEFGSFLKEYYGNIKTGYDEAVNAAKRRYMSRFTSSLGNNMSPAQIAQYQTTLMQAGGRYLQSKGMNKTMIPTAEAMAQINELAGVTGTNGSQMGNVNIDASQKSNVVTNQNMGLVMDKSTPAMDMLNGGISRYNPAGYASAL